MKKINILMMAAAVLVGCTKGNDSLQPQAAKTPVAEKESFTLVINANSVATKALFDVGETLGSEWKQGDSVSVHNLTAKEAIEGWLYAEADGFSTVFSGTVSGNINQGDTLMLNFLTPDYWEQDGSLEGVAAQSDWSVALVEVKNIDPETKMIATEKAEFEKKQAVVKFNITDRNTPAEAVKVDTLIGSGWIPGALLPFKITVTPEVATDELYVAIPAIEGMEIDFYANDTDGNEYSLTVPSVSFKEGLYYRRTLQMKRKAYVKAPVAINSLVYNTKAQKLVSASHVYYKANGMEASADGVKDYKNDTCVVFYFAKKVVEAGVIPAAPTKEENGWSRSVPKATDAGTYYVWTMMEGTDTFDNVPVSESAVPVTIAKAPVSITFASDTLKFASTDAVNATKNVSVTRSGDGTVQAATGDATVATVSVNGTTVTVKRTNKATKSTTITVSVAEGTNYKAGSSTFTVKMEAVDPAVPLASAQYGYKVLSNGKAYPADATNPSGASVIGMVLKGGFVIMAGDVGPLSYTAASAYSASVDVYISDFNATSTRTFKMWNLDNAIAAEIYDSTWEDVSTKLIAAGCTGLVNGQMYAFDDVYFKAGTGYMLWDGSGSLLLRPMLKINEN